MSEDPGRARSALERLVPELVPPADASPTVSTFLRGLAIGSLVGAAIAGSAILQRRRSHRGGGAPPDSVTPDGDPDRPTA